MLPLKGQLVGLFYPKCFINPDLLKQMVLYFDRIYVVKPSDNLAPEHNDLFDFWETTKIFQDEEIVIPIPT
jgi:hypothetical protein